MEPQEATSSPTNLKQMFKKLDALYYLFSMCTTKLQLLKQHDPGQKKKKTYRPKKERTEPKNKSTHLWTTDL